MEWSDLSIYLRTAVEVIAIFVILVGLLQSFVYFGQILIAMFVLYRGPTRVSVDTIWDTVSDLGVPISLLVPAYNEEQTIVESVKSLLALEYPNFEVIVINDGSKDGTLQHLQSGFRLREVVRAYDPTLTHEPIRGFYASHEYPSLLVVDKENGGKADATNTGITVSRSPLFCVIDADSILEPDSLLRVVQPFVQAPERVVAVGGTIRIVNGCVVEHGRVLKVALPSKFIELFQTVEYLRAFLIGRLAWGELNALTLISGAFGVFRRDVAIDAGGYRPDSQGEDLEVVVSMHQTLREQKRDYAIEFIPEPVCWTQVPVSLRDLAPQRVRWQRGALETLWRHRRMVLNPRYGRFGIIGMGQILLFDLLGPVSEMLGYLLLPTFFALGMLDVEYVLGFFALSIAFGIFFSVSALLLEEAALKRYPGTKSLIILIAVSVLENFGYRQLTNLYRLKGTWQHFRGKSATWVSPPRIEFRRQ